MNIKFKTIFLILAAFLITSCVSNALYGKMYAIDGAWDKGDIKTFLIPINIGKPILNISFVVRNDNAYPFSNLFLISKLTTPSGIIQTDTLEYKMANLEGKWLGKGLGSIKESKLLYKEKMHFNLKGIYKVEVSHALRRSGEAEGVRAIEGITDIGILVEE